MITACDLPAEGNVSRSDETIDGEHVAKTFLQGERSLAELQKNEQVAQLLHGFLGAAGDAPLRIRTETDRSVIVSTGDGAACLLLTGRTAEVLLGYLRGDDVSIADRMDMTMRRSRHGD